MSTVKAVFGTKPPPSPGFELYFAGSLNKTAEAYLRSNGANRLASQLLDRNVISGWIGNRVENKDNGHLFIDSGAFSAHTKNAEVNVDAYISFINSIDDDVHICAQVDKIPGVFRKPKSRADLADAPLLSWGNYLYMRKCLKSPDKLLPIFHQGEDYKWLENMLETTFDGKHIPYIGISPANDQPTKEKEKFIDKCFKIIEKSSNPKVKTHAFGMTSLHLLEQYPFTSADSTSWIMNGANGSIMSKYGSVIISSKSPNAPNHIRKMPKDAQQAIQNYVEQVGYTMEGLEHDYKQRIIFNIQYLLQWSRNYVYSTSSIQRHSLF